MPIAVELVVVDTGVVPGLPVEHELAVVLPPHPLLLPLGAEVAVLDGLLLLDLARSRVGREQRAKSREQVAESMYNLAVSS